MVTDEQLYVLKRLDDITEQLAEAKSEITAAQSETKAIVVTNTGELKRLSAHVDKQNGRVSALERAEQQRTEQEAYAKGIRAGGMDILITRRQAVGVIGAIATIAATVSGIFELIQHLT